MKTGVEYRSTEPSFGWKRMWGGIGVGEGLENMGEVYLGTVEMSSVPLSIVR